MSLSGSRARARHSSGATPRMMARTMPTIFLQGFGGGGGVRGWGGGRRGAGGRGKGRAGMRCVGGWLRSHSHHYHYVVSVCAQQHPGRQHVAPRSNCCALSFHCFTPSAPAPPSPYVSPFSPFLLPPPRAPQPQHPPSPHLIWCSMKLCPTTTSRTQGCPCMVMASALKLMM